jgi:hypothetical protein
MIPLQLKDNMTYIKWLILILMSFVIDILGIIVVPIAIFFSDGKTLPWLFQAWDNKEEPIGDTARAPAIEASIGLQRGYLRWCWLALRNPGHNFGYWIGYTQSVDIVYTYSGDPLTSDQGHPGLLSVQADSGIFGKAFCLYYVKRWGTSSKCLRVFLGWKIHDMVKDGKKAQIVCVINPAMTFEEAA